MFSITPRPDSEIIALTLVPGAHAQTATEQQKKPCGQCEGVIYLDKLQTYVDGPNGEVLPCVKPSSMLEALRYLRPMSPVWKALHAGMDGVCRPRGIANVLDLSEINLASRVTGRAVQWLFSCHEHCVEIAQTKTHERANWRIYRVAEDVWAVLYVPRITGQMSAAASMHSPVQPAPVTEAES